MRRLIALIRKECMEQIRSSKLVILGIIFIAFGIMNPAIAKLTPWILEMMADTLAESGMVVSSVVVDASASWAQFYKNVPMALLVFVLMQSNIYTKEYETGTLIPILTKGVERYKIVISKTMVITVLWSVCYWMCYLITYVYNDFYWDNGIMNNLVFSAVCWWMFGIWTLAVMVLLSTMVKTNSGVLVGTGAIVFVLYLMSMLPKINKYLPTKLMESASLTSGIENVSAYIGALIITIFISIACIIVGIVLFNKKNI